jgi:DNA modification methylase
VDLVLTDPPYGVGLKYVSHDDSRENHKEFVAIFMKEILKFKVVILTPGYKSMFFYPEPNYVLIRFDPTAQSPHGLAYMNKWEPIYVYGKPIGKRPAWDVLETKCQVERKAIPVDHPCPKPISLMHQLCEIGSKIGNTILDPFMGSGTTAIACERINRRWIGIEISEEYCEITSKRIESERKQEKLYGGICENLSVDTRQKETQQNLL